MPTLGEACQMLRVSRRTLDKWLERLKIEPTRHEYDLRFWTISAEDVQRIREERAKMPGMAVYGGYGFTPHHAPVAPIRSYRALDDDRRKSERGSSSIIEKWRF